MIINVSQVYYMYRNLRTRNEAVYNKKSMVGMKVEPVSKLRARKLQLSSRERNRLKEEKVI
jgi:nitrate/TMAO reductase-like tetraheme cytochrome c subunit